MKKGGESSIHRLFSLSTVYFQAVGNRRITPSFLESDRQLLALVDDNLSKIIETLCKRLFSEKGIVGQPTAKVHQRAKFAVLQAYLFSSPSTRSHLRPVLSAETTYCTNNPLLLYQIGYLNPHCYKSPAHLLLSCANNGRSHILFSSFALLSNAHMNAAFVIRCL